MAIAKKGDRVQFTIPDSHERAGQVVEGVVKVRPRNGIIKVVETIGVTREVSKEPRTDGLPPAVNYTFEETIWTIPTWLRYVIVSSPSNAKAPKPGT